MALAGRSPGFWLASAAVFTVNALISVRSGHWGLGLLQVVTASVAVGAAMNSLRDRRRRNGEDGDHRP